MTPEAIRSVLQVVADEFGYEVQDELPWDMHVEPGMFVAWISRAPQGAKRQDNLIFKIPPQYVQGIKRPSVFADLFRRQIERMETHAAPDIRHHASLRSRG